MPSMLRQVELEFDRNLTARIDMMRKTTVELDKARDHAVSQVDSQQAELHYEAAQSNYSALVLAKNLFEDAVREVREKSRCNYKLHLSHIQRLREMTGPYHVELLPREQQELSQAVLFLLEEML